jgi:hypothetical protein
MQIHELTYKQVNEGLGSALGGLVGGAKAAMGRAGQAVSPGADYRGARDEQVRAQQMGMLADKAQRAWTAYAKQLAQTQTVTPQDLQNSLRAFVQKNFMGDLKYQYDSLTNKQQIENLLGQIADPKNAGQQKQLWNNLIKTITVSLPGARTSVAGGAPGPAAGAASQKQGATAGGGFAPGVNPADIQKSILGLLNATQFNGLSDIAQTYAGTSQVGSTGNAGVDAFLKTLKFNIT